MDTFSTLLKKIGKKDEFTITFTRENIASDDNFLIQVYYRGETEKVTFKRSSWGIWCVYFTDDEPMLLENCPESFWRSIIKNL